MNRFDELRQLIKFWTDYVNLRRKIYKGRHMPQAWHNRLNKIEVKIHNWELEKSLIGELNL